MAQKEKNPKSVASDAVPKSAYEPMVSTSAPVVEEPGLLKRMFYADMYQKKNIASFHKKKHFLLTTCIMIATISVDIFLIIIAALFLNLLVYGMEEAYYDSLHKVAPGITEAKLDEDALNEAVWLLTAVICSICMYSILTDFFYYQEMQFRHQCELEDIYQEKLHGDLMERRYNRDLLYIEARELQKQQGGALNIEYEEVEKKDVEVSMGRTCSAFRRRRQPVANSEKSRSGELFSGKLTKRPRSMMSSVKHRERNASHEPDHTQINDADSRTLSVKAGTTM